MSISFQAKDVQVQGQQLKVQEICLRADNPLISVSGGDLLISINETLSAVLSCQKQIAAGTLSGIVGAVANTNQIRLTGESAAAATTTYVVKYVVAE